MDGPNPETIFHQNMISESRRRRGSAGSNSSYYLHTEADNLFQLGDTVRSPIVWEECLIEAVGNHRMRFLVPYILKMMEKAEEVESLKERSGETHNRWVAMANAVETFSGISLKEARKALKLPHH